MFSLSPRISVPLFLIASATLALLAPAHAITWDVPTQCPTIQAGIDSAASGDTVLVACGTYYEHEIDMGDGVILLSETGEPDCVTIDADSLGSGIRCYNLMDPATAIEGFTITGGLEPFWGGGIDALESVLRVTNCVLTDNYAYDLGTAGKGGGMGIVGGNVQVDMCTFSYNRADRNGGGIHCQGESTLVVSITECTFLENTAGIGGGGLNFGPARSENVTVSGCTFDGNVAHGIGGGGLNCGGTGTAPTISECLFIRNQADSASGSGGGLSSRVYATPTISLCTFQENYAHLGGGMHVDTSDPTLNNCDFESNDAYHGGGMHAEESNTTLTDCIFEGNDADEGAGLYSTGGVPELEGCTFYLNEAQTAGGGIQVTDGDMVLTDVTFDSNRGQVGSGASCVRSSPAFTGCAFLDNWCEYNGAGFYAADSASVTLTECLFSGNESDVFGGALFFYQGSGGTVTNCTLYGNEAPAGGAIAAYVGSSVTMENTIIADSDSGWVSHCWEGGAVGLTCCDVYDNLWGNWVECFAGQNGVNGNFSADPLFCDVDSLDFTLDASSPCLNAPGCGLVGAFGEGCGSGSGVITGAGSGSPAFGFLGSWPNPVRSAAHLSFSLVAPGRATLEVFDTGGRRVAVLADRGFDAGISDVTWDGRDASGRQVASGVYFCRLQAGERVATQKVVLVVK